MKRLVTSFSLAILFFIFAVASAWAELRAIPIEKFNPDDYQQGTFFSLIFERNNPNIIWIAPSEGAVWANGTEVKDVVRHYGGHEDLRLAVKKVMQKENFERVRFFGAGFSVDKKGHFKFSFRSRSQNGNHNDGLLAEKYQNELIDVIKEHFPEKFPPPRKSIAAHCQSFFSSLGFAR